MRCALHRAYKALIKRCEHLHYFLSELTRQQGSDFLEAITRAQVVGVEALEAEAVSELTRESASANLDVTLRQN